MREVTRGEDKLCLANIDGQHLSFWCFKCMCVCVVTYRFASSTTDLYYISHSRARMNAGESTKHRSIAFGPSSTHNQSKNYHECSIKQLKSLLAFLLRVREIIYFVCVRIYEPLSPRLNHGLGAAQFILFSADNCGLLLAENWYWYGKICNGRRDIYGKWLTE